MQSISTKNHTVIKDDAGRIVIVLANDLTIVDIGEPIPEGTLGWDKDSGTFYRHVSGAWVSNFGFSSLASDTLAVFSGEAHFLDGLHVHGQGDLGGIKWFAGQGTEATEAHAHEGAISVDLDLAGASSAATVADFIPARSMVWRAAVEILTAFTGGSVTQLDLGATGVSDDGLFDGIALIDLHDFTAGFPTILTGNNTAAGITVKAKQAGGGAASVTTGKIRLTLWTSHIDGPDDAVYA